MNNTIFVLDTCVILNRPRILQRLLATEGVSKVMIPEVVVYELNYQKDHGKKQQAWLAMVSIEKLCKENPNRISVVHEEQAEGINDQKIIFAAKQVAKRNADCMVYLLTDDVLFSLAVERASNFEVLNPQKFEQKFPVNTGKFNKVASGTFFAAVKAGNLTNARKNFVKDVDPNFIDPVTGYTPLIQAIRNKSVAMVEFLTNLPGINLNLCDEAKHYLCRRFKGFYVKNLRTNVTVNTVEFDVFTRNCFLYSFKSLACFECKTEFAVYLSCHYSLVSVSVDTGFDAEHYTRLDTLFLCDSFKSVELGNIVNDYMSYTDLKSIRKLLICLVIAVEADFLHRKACLYSSVELTDRNSVETVFFACNYAAHLHA